MTDEYFIKVKTAEEREAKENTDDLKILKVIIDRIEKEMDKHPRNEWIFDFEILEKWANQSSRIDHYVNQVIKIYENAGFCAFIDTDKYYDDQIDVEYTYNYLIIRKTTKKE